MEYRTKDGITIEEAPDFGEDFYRDGYRVPSSGELNNYILGKAKKSACDILQTNYTEYCDQGLSFTYETVEYTISNTEKTSNEINKKITNVALDIDDSFDWTMDLPRTKITFADKASCLVFIKAVQAVIASNETLLRDKKTDIDNYDLSQVETFIATPNYPTYGRTV